MSREGRRKFARLTDCWPRRKKKVRRHHWTLLDEEEKEELSFVSRNWNFYPSGYCDLKVVQVGTSYERDPVTQNPEQSPPPTGATGGEQGQTNFPPKKRQRGSEEKRDCPRKAFPRDPRLARNAPKVTPVSSPGAQRWRCTASHNQPHITAAAATTTGRHSGRAVGVQPFLVRRFAPEGSSRWATVRS